LDPVSANYRRAHQSPANGANALAPKDDTYLPRAALGKELDLDDNQAKAFIRHWANKPSKINKGEKALRSRPEFSTDTKQTRTEQLKFRLGDGRAIKRGEEYDRPPNDRPPADQEARRMIYEFLLTSGPAEHSKFFEFCREKNISIRQRRSAIRKWKIHIVQVGAGPGKFCCYCLPHQKPGQPWTHTPKLSKAVYFLREILADGDGKRRPRLVALGRQRGISEGTLWNARPYAPVSSSHGIWKLCKEPKVQNDRQQPAAETSAPIESAAQMTKEETADNQVDAPPAATDAPKRRGRKINPKVEEIYQQCYDGRKKGTKASIIRLRLEKTFPGRGPKEDATVILYAARYKRRHGL